ncbi:MAG TPA: tRNA threonylcarbamoyladenosine dehydratase [Saprospiraceae bacterium]|nr:tRNA threonylcarbamoyladenosine dehydratase [Saprospiraceae bacterium]
MAYIDWLERTELLIGEEALVRLNNANILLVGLGGVGSFAGEFLIRSGIGNMTIVDGDAVDHSNKNRQLQALDSTIGQNKAFLLYSRYKDINPDANLTYIERFLEPNDIMDILEDQRYDYVLDCIDSVSPKITLITIAKRQNIKIISSMGAGGKLDPSKIKVSDIAKSKECKFAQQVRKRLKKEGIKTGIPVVYSEEIQPKEALKYTDGTKYKRSYYGTISYMPALFGLTIAAEVIQSIINEK